MKHICLSLVLAITLISCGGNATSDTVQTLVEKGDLKAIRAYRDTLVRQEKEINKELKILDKAIHALDKTEKSPLVSTVILENKTFNHFVEFQGSVNTKNLLVLFPEFSGILSKVYIKEGQRVVKGQVLAKIDDGGIAQQVAQAEIKVALSKTTFERQQKLWQQKIGSEIQFLQAKSQYEAQSKMVAQLKQQWAKTSIKAPFSGIIDEILSEEGSMMVAGQSPAMRIISLKDMYIETDIPESYLSEIRKGKKVEVFFPVIQKTVISEVDRISNFIHPSNRTFKVKISVPNPGGTIKPNLTAKVKINDYTNNAAILVPLNFISENSKGEQFVYLVKDKNKDIAKAIKTIVTTGKTQGDQIEILTGLNSGAEVISEGARKVLDQQQVRIRN